MKVSKKIFQKSILLIILIGILAGIVCLVDAKKYNEYYYEYYANVDIIKEEIISNSLFEFRCMTRDISYGNSAEETIADGYFQKLCKNGYDLNGDGKVEEEEFVQVKTNYYKSYAYSFYQKSKVLNIIIVILIIALISVFIGTLRYFINTNKIIKKIKNYSNYMLATEKYKIEDISKEFGETIDRVEKDIQKAIDKKILKEVYLSKHTKEILLVKKV